MTVINSTLPTTGSGEDHHSGWFEIVVAQTVNIAARKQMVVFGTFVMDGTLNIDGQLILET